MSDKQQVQVLEPDQWLKSSSNLTFFKDFKGTFVYEVVKIENPGVKNLMSKNFEFMSRNLSFVSTQARILLGKDYEEQIGKAEEIVRNTVNNGLNTMLKRVGQAEAVLTSKKIPFNTECNKAANLKVPLTTPGAATYVELLRTADHFYSLNSLMWIRGLIDDPHYWNEARETRSEIMNIVKGVYNQFRYILKVVDAKNREAATAILAKNEEMAASSAIKAVDDELGGGAHGSDAVLEVGKPAADNQTSAAKVEKPKRTRAKSSKEQQAVAA